MADSVPAAPVGAGPADVDAAPDVAAIVLAAGAGTRLAPLTRLRPKVLCPVADRPLVDHAIGAVAATGAEVAVNVHHRREQLETHLRARGDVHVSIEEPEALGTAGAVAHLRGWLAGRGALVVNGDTWSAPDLGAFVAGWDRERVRVLVAGPPAFGPRSTVVASLLPTAEVQRLEVVPSGLWEVCWRRLVATPALDVVGHDGPVLDGGTPARYLAANRLVAARLAGGPPPAGAEPGPSWIHPSARVAPDAVVEGSVIGAGAHVAGTVRCSVLWPGTEVAPAEVLVDAVRASSRMTVLVR